MIDKDRCEVCGTTDDLHVDHGHDHGYIRGILCAACNKAEGLLRGDPERARSLAIYMEKAEHTGLLYEDWRRVQRRAQERKDRATPAGRARTQAAIRRRTERARTDPEYREYVNAQRRARYHRGKGML